MKGSRSTPAAGQEVMALGVEVDAPDFGQSRFGSLGAGQMADTAGPDA